MLRKELQSYLNSVYSESKIESVHSHIGQIHIRFELGEDEENGTIERVNKSANSAMTIFNETFNDLTNEIFILIYEYQGENIFDASNDYLHKQFPIEKFEKFYSQLEKVNTNSDTTDQNENDVLELDEIRIIIGKLMVKDMNVKNILLGIANTEMGFEPAINQRILFFDPLTDRAFQMYDDLGCYVWSDKADKIHDIYIQRNDWIAEYHRPEIEKYFMQGQ